MSLFSNDIRSFYFDSVQNYYVSGYRIKKKENGCRLYGHPMLISNIRLVISGKLNIHHDKGTESGFSTARHPLNVKKKDLDKHCRASSDTTERRIFTQNKKRKPYTEHPLNKTWMGPMPTCLDVS